MSIMPMTARRLPSPSPFSTHIATVVDTEIATSMFILNTTSGVCPIVFPHLSFPTLFDIGSHTRLEVDLPQSLLVLGYTYTLASCTRTFSCDIAFSTHSDWANLVLQYSDFVMPLSCSVIDFVKDIKYRKKIVDSNGVETEEVCNVPSDDIIDPVAQHKKFLLMCSDEPEILTHRSFFQQGSRVPSSRTNG
ncbi:hypothetical protein EXIGLDRAFT_766902 [Exidia glandulosa HHB12029]|uniref:Uncharacterized protein n=1 Tax=Exidia glandulosa HHB12029 TaxID=1314781 RepID=A0A165JEW6_EXIGL|nr:hypothetical protein EXIGLDRAFT_766902 [Exidia glandulosa HHB12029]